MSQSIDFMEEIKRNDNNSIIKSFSYDLDKVRYSIFEDFIQYNYDLIKCDTDIAWKYLNNLGYNNFLEKKYLIRVLNLKKMIRK